MDDFCDRKIGDWLPDFGFWKECPVDGTRFWGRKNQIYCGPKCKARVAADLLSERRKERAPFVDPYVKNFEILKKYYPFSLGKEPIRHSLLTNSGFNDTGPFKEIKLRDREGDWYQVGYYAYTLLENAQSVIITKIKTNGPNN